MTAEIGILNMSGVALAADSAVTIGTNLTQKVYNSANKLFALTKHHPVGIMVYGSSHFNGVPWEIIIKEFRKSLSQKKFDYLELYCNEFFNFITNSDRVTIHYAEGSQVKIIFESYLKGILYEIEQKLSEQFAEDAPTEEEIIIIIKQRVEHLIKEFSQVSFLEGFDEDFIEEFKSLHEGNIEYVLEQYIFVKLTKELIELFTVLSAHMFSKDIVSDRVSGIVIAGYGEKEIFPSMYEYETEGMFCNKIKISSKYSTIIGSETTDSTTTASIRAFAQNEMVQTFMHGIDPRMETTLLETLVDSLEDQYPQIIQDILHIDLTEEQVRGIKELGVSFNSKFKRELNRIQREEFINPIIHTVDVLPKEELAAMAEALVNLTSFKRKVTIDAETVGGPIDVAVISKGDGFVWIKRKHYFKPELNYHFFQNYRRGDYFETSNDI